MGLDTLQDLLYKRRVTWLGHLARRMDSDEGAKQMINNREGAWWERMIQDLTNRGCTVDTIIQNCNNKNMLLNEVISKDPRNFQ